MSVHSLLDYRCRPIVDSTPHACVRVWEKGFENTRRIEVT